VALSAVSCVTGLECLGAVMALAAILACVHVSHGHLGCTLLHLEDLGVAVIALKTLVSMSLAIEHDLACAAACKLNGLSRRNCKRTAYKCYDNEQNNK